MTRGGATRVITEGLPDATGLRDDAKQLAARAEETDRIAGALRKVDLGPWSGQAAEAFADALVVVARALHKSADDALAVARALSRHADVVEWARDCARDMDLEADGGRARLTELQAAVAESAVRTAAALREIAQGASQLADGWDVLRMVRSQYYTGVAEGAVGIVQGLYQFSAVRFAIEPQAVIDDGIALAAGLAAGLRDPVGMARAVTDYDTWRTEPIRAAGRLVPDILLSAATAGTGSAAAAAGRGIRGVGAAARAAGDALSPVRDGHSPRAPRTADEMREELSRLPAGRHRHVRLVGTEDLLRELFRHLTDGAEPAEAPASYKGEWLRHADGTQVSLRETSRSGGPTIDVRYPDGTKDWKVHVDDEG